MTRRRAEDSVLTGQGEDDKVSLDLAMELDNEFVSFVRHIKTSVAPLTAQAYQRDVLKLYRLAGETAVTALTTSDLRRFLVKLHSGGLSGRSLARALASWRRFYRFLQEENPALADPCQGLRPPKSPKRLPSALDPEEAARLVEIKVVDALSAQDRAVYELFYSSGLRLSELINLRPGDIDYHERMVRVTGKGNKTREVPVGKPAVQAIQTWLEYRQQITGIDTEALFVGRRGQRISRRVVQERLRCLAIQQGLSRHVHPHMLRHSFASHLLQSSGDLRAVQELLGHTSIAATQVYAHLDFQHLTKIYDAAHPRAKRQDEDDVADQLP